MHGETMKNKKKAASSIYDCTVEDVELRYIFFGDKHKSNQNVFRPSCSSSTRYAYYLICVCLLSSPAIATLYHGIASAGPTCSYVIRLCAAMLLRQLLSCYHALPW